MSIKRALIAALPRPLRRSVERRRHARLSYSQEGEDLLLQRIFDGQSTGIYVDVGAHHPFRFSNTYAFYRAGWRGINIDALPGSMAAFEGARPRDINLELGIATSPAMMTFAVFEEPALNTFDGALARQRVAMGWPLRGHVEVRCEPLAAILEAHLPRLAATAIDFMSVDVEGYDLAVLRSNDWSRFCPLAVVVEILDQDLSGVTRSDIGSFLSQVGYRPFAKLHHSAVFLRND